jgi:hypothetical protein
LDQIDDAPAHDTVDRRERSVLDDPAQRCALVLIEQRPVARRLAGCQTRRPLGVEPQNPIPHRLKPDTADRGCLGARLARIDRRKRQQSANLPGVGHRSGELAKLCGVIICSKPNRSGHGEPLRDGRRGELYSSRLGNLEASVRSRAR